MNSQSNYDIKLLRDRLEDFQESYNDPADIANFTIFSNAITAIDELLARREAAERPVVFIGAKNLSSIRLGRTCIGTVLVDELTGTDVPLYAAPPLLVMPDVLPCSVKLEPGLVLGKGVKTQTLVDALFRREKYYAELEAMTAEQRAEHKAGIASIKSMLSLAPNPEVE